MKAEMFGQSEDVRIIIGENLTKKNATLFNYCNSLKKEGKISQLYTSYGLIHIKFKRGKNEKSHIIRTKPEVEILCQQNFQKSASNIESSNSMLPTPSQPISN